MKDVELKKILEEAKEDHFHDIVYRLGLSAVETTTGTNGYPQDIKWAILPEDMNEYKQLRGLLPLAGFEVEEVLLRKRDGWQLWCRQGAGYVDEEYFFKEGGNYTDFVEEDDGYEKLFDLLIGPDWKEQEKYVERAQEYEEDNMEKAFEYVEQDIIEELQYEFNLDTDGDVTRMFFDDNKREMFQVNNLSTGYYYDTWSYHLGLILKKKSNGEN